MSAFRAKEQRRREHRSMHRQSKWSPKSNDRLFICLPSQQNLPIQPFLIVHCQKHGALKHVYLCISKTIATPSFIRFTGDSKQKYNNCQNSLNYNWEKGMQNRLTDPQCDANFSGNDLRGMQDCQKQNVSTIAAN